ncbi:bacteriorhodopsin [Halogeometricum limi]|uniref:Sensory rhodopsin n=1 Tax=Halogeometricum limi TaxID=555875 RepID=A0A1I6HD25_9EURY|nr:bacteriorhodopsin [Halogeometricum limi]SFR52278.1 sensory rhodopsin [Halogeometricum limi]
MELTVTLWLWVGAVGMALGTLVPLGRFVRDEESRVYTAVLTGVTAIAAVAYALMAQGYAVSLPGLEGVELVRYVDWLLTTPLMVLYLGLLSRSGPRVYAALVAADVVVVTSGVVAAALSGPTRYVAFGVGAVAYLVLSYLLLRTLPRRASFQSGDHVATFTTVRNLTVVVWSLYPVVWLLAPTGVGLLLPETQVLVMTYLDLVSKVGFVVVAVRGLDGITSHGTARTTTAD